MNERELFLAALDIDDPAERQAFLQNACADDAVLLQQVETLLESHDAQSQFLETPVVEQVGDGSSETGETQLVDRAALRRDEADGDAAGEWLAGFLTPSDEAGSLGRLGHYEIQEVIGSGAFGTVLKAIDEKLQRVVAIKVMSPEMAATSPARKRFLREARSSAAVRHENVVSIYAVEDEPIPFLVMEYIPGQTLQQRLDGNGPLGLTEVLKLGGQLAEGLAAAHAKDLIHRDIKPGNILLDTSVGDHVKITDFGLARTADDASLTQSGLIAGTPMYMAPEQARGETLDHRADLFSLGSVLYQMVSGRPPFRASNAVAVLKRVCEDTPRAIQEVIPETPDWLCQIIFRLLEKDREDRFQSACEVADVLRRCAAELEESGRVTSVSVVLSQRPQSSEQPSRDDQRIKRTALMTAVMMLVAFVAVQVISPRLARWLDTPIPELSSAKQVGGLRFDGRDDWVEVPNLEWHYPQFTIEAFVTSKSGSDNGTIAFLSGGESGKREWMSLFDGGRAQPGKRISGVAAKGQTAYENAYGPFAGGKRQHRALVFDGKYLHYYINGVWQGERHAAPYEGLQWKMSELRLGCDGSGKQFFEGVIDLVRVSRVARYDDNFPAVETLDSDDLTLALYNCDETSGRVLTDASGNDHHGIVHGAAWLRGLEGKSSPESTGGTGLEFDGVDDYITTPVRYDASSGLTIEVTVLMSEWPDKDSAEIVSDTHNGGVSLAASKDGFKFAVHDGDGYVHAWIPRDDQYLNRPVKLAGVIRKRFTGQSAMLLFVDGRLIDQEPLKAVQAGDQAFSLGTSPGDGQPRDEHDLEWKGQLLEVRISDYAWYIADYDASKPLTPSSHALVHYHFDEGQGDVLNDSSSNGHHGKIVGAKWVGIPASQAVAGSYALSFDDPEDSVVVPGLRGKLDGGPVTVEAWVTMGTGELPDDQRISIFRDKTSMYAHLQLHKTWRFWRATTARGQGLVTSQTPQPSERTHVAAVWTGRRGMIFVNGQLAETKAAHVQGLTFDGEAPTWIGGLADTPILKESFVPYSIDELRISSTARYSEGFTPEDSYQPDDHTLALYHFDDGTGSVLNDSSGNGHHGNIDGATWVGIGR